jgi:pilus assembly protein Flp/PilA
MSRRSVRRTDQGASAVEYALLLAALAAVIVVGVFSLGRALSATLQRTNDCIANKGCASATPASTSTRGSGDSKDGGDNKDNKDGGDNKDNGGDNGGNGKD